MTEYTPPQLNKIIEVAAKGDYQPLSVLLSEAYSEYKVPIVVKLLQTIMQRQQSPVTVKKDIALAILEVSRSWNKPAFFTTGNMLGQILQYCNNDVILTQAIVGAVSDDLKSERIHGNDLYDLERTLSGLVKDSTRNLYLEILENIDSKKFVEFCEFIVRRNDDKITQVILDHIEREIPESLIIFNKAKNEERKLAEEKKHSQACEDYTSHDEQPKQSAAKVLLSQTLSVDNFFSEAEALLEKVYPKYYGIYCGEYLPKYGTYEDIALLMRRLETYILQGLYSIQDLKCRERVYKAALDHKQEELAYLLSSAIGESSLEAGKAALRSRCNILFQRILISDPQTICLHNINWLRYAAKYNNFEAFKIIVAYSTPDNIYQMIHEKDNRGNTLAHSVKYAPNELFEEILNFMLNYLTDFSVPNHVGSFPFENDPLRDKYKTVILQELHIPIFPSIDDLEKKDDIEALKKFISQVPSATLRQFFFLPVMGINKLIPDTADDWKGCDFSSCSYFIYAINKNRLEIVQTLTEQCLLCRDVFTENERIELLTSGINYAKNAIRYHHSSKAALDYLQAQLLTLEAKQQPRLMDSSAVLFQPQMLSVHHQQNDQAMLKNRLS